MQWASHLLMSFGFLLFLLPTPAPLQRVLSLLDTSVPLVIDTASGERNAGQETEITKTNWQQHPKIKAVRAVVQSVDADLKKRRYKVSKREFEYCEPYADTERMMAADANGRVRQYGKAGGSEDSSLNWKHYYDEGGHLRFVFITGGATNGAQLEHRIYFDETGKRIWEDQKYVKGTAYTFPEVWPEKDLQISDPAKAFAAASPCPETKAGAKKQKRG